MRRYVVLLHYGDSTHCASECSRLRGVTYPTFESYASAAAYAAANYAGVLWSIVAYEYGDGSREYVRRRVDL